MNREIGTPIRDTDGRLVGVLKGTILHHLHRDERGWVQSASTLDVAPVLAQVLEAADAEEPDGKHALFIRGDDGRITGSVTGTTVRSVERDEKGRVASAVTSSVWTLAARRLLRSKHGPELVSAAASRILRNWRPDDGPEPLVLALQTLGVAIAEDADGQLVLA